MSDVRYASGEVPEVGDRVRIKSFYAEPHHGRVVSVLPFLFVDADGDPRDWVSEEDCRLLTRASKDLPTIDGSGVFHPAPVADVPDNHIVDANKMVPAPDWQPFDGEFKQGVEYRSRDGNVWRYSCDDGTARMSVRLITDNQNIKSGWFNKDGSSAPPEWDITHQRRRHAETGEKSCAAPLAYAVMHSDAQFDYRVFATRDEVDLFIDGLTCEWGQRNYVNPPFGSIIHQGKKKGPTAWARKSIEEHRKGKTVVLVFPIDKWVLMLVQEILGSDAEIRNLGDVRWLATEDGSQGKGTGRHIACFILRH